MRVHLLIGAVALGWTPLAAAATTYHYEAYFAGLKVGSAAVAVERDASTYRIEGRAAARGVAAFFSDWQSDFYANGLFGDLGPILLTYGFDERERKKHRVLTLSDGVVDITRNGRTRPPMPVLEGLDVLTAFFITPACWKAQLVHTGRYNYWIDGRPGKEDGCDLEVTDDDGDLSRVRLWFEEHDGFLVPARLSIGGLLKGRIVLRRIEEPSPASASTAPDSAMP
jgi:hypothetical protein